MADLTKPMSDKQIERLDYFEKTQLYHNVYMETPYATLPKGLKSFYNKNSGLVYLQSVLNNSNLQDPYEIAKLIQALKPAKPQSLQEVYARARYLADVCDTTIDKILRSTIFNVQDFIPQLSEERIQEALKNGVTGAVPTAIKKSTDYTPAPEEPSGETVIITGDYTDENKVYFTVSGTLVTCNKSFSDVIASLPKLPEAELILNAMEDYQNISSITCGYDASSETIHFNFIQIYNAAIKLYTIHFSALNIALEESNFIIDANANTN